MDCKKISAENLHDKYLSGDISESEKKAYLKHLKTCSDCARDLVQEEIIRDSIRRHGRNLMKGEIRNQVADLKASNRVKPMPDFLKIAAAVLFLILTPAIIYHYYQIPADRVDNIVGYGPEELTGAAEEYYSEDDNDLADISTIETDKKSPIAETEKKEKSMDKEMVAAQPAAATMKKSDKDMEKSATIRRSAAAKRAESRVSESRSTGNLGRLAVQEESKVEDVDDEILTVSGAGVSSAKGQSSAVIPLDEIPLIVLDYKVDENLISLLFYAASPSRKDSTADILKLDYVHTTEAKIELKAAVTLPMMGLSREELQVTLPDSNRLQIEIENGLKILIQMDSDPPKILK